MKELQGTGHRAPGTGHRVTVDGDMGGSNVDMCSVGDSCIVDWGEEMGTPRQFFVHTSHAFNGPVGVCNGMPQCTCNPESDLLFEPPPTCHVTRD
jgi:hypothetical protein